MAIILKKNKASNKDKSLVKTTTEPTPLKSSPHGPVWVSQPFIDKLSVIIHLTNDEHAADAYGSLMLHQGDPEVLLNAGAAKSKGYNFRKRIHLPSVVDKKRLPLLEVRHADKKVGSVRIEFVPVDLGGTGLSELHAALTLFFHQGWGYFVELGHVTRIDVAVDIYGVGMDQVFILPAQGTNVTRWKTNGHLETVYFGKQNASQTIIYDRSAKRAKQPAGWEGESCIRVERRQKGQNFPLKDLATLKNPFAAVPVIGHLPGSGSDIKPNDWTLFSDSVSVRGAASALKLLPVKRRTSYRKHLASSPTPWWNPEEIWKQWPTVLAETDIAETAPWP